MSTDPYNQYTSPYVGMGNNPVSGFDVNGGESNIERPDGYKEKMFKGDWYKSDREVTHRVKKSAASKCAITYL